MFSEALFFKIRSLYINIPLEVIIQMDLYRNLFYTSRSPNMKYTFWLL